MTWPWIFPYVPCLREHLPCVDPNVSFRLLDGIRSPLCCIPLFTFDINRGRRESFDNKGYISHSWSFLVIFTLERWSRRVLIYFSCSPSLTLISLDLNLLGFLEGIEESWILGLVFHPLDTLDLWFFDYTLAYTYYWGREEETPSPRGHACVMYSCWISLMEIWFFLIFPSLILENLEGCNNFHRWVCTLTPSLVCVKSFQFSKIVSFWI